MSDTPVFIDRETIRLTKDGIFLSDGEPIEHARTLEAFHRFLGRDAEGCFIRIGRDFKRIEVEDTAAFVTDLAWIGTDEDLGVELALRDGTRQRLDPETLAYRPERLTCRVRLADGREEEAKFLRKPYLEFFLRTLDDDRGFAIRLGGKTIRL